MIPTIIIIGLSGIVAQAIILRELLVSFYGNELTLGIILANWVLPEAVGALVIGRSIDKAENKADIFLVLQSVFYLILPLSIYAARVFKGLLGIPFGETVSLAGIWFVSLLIIFPCAFCHGGLFALLCKISGIGKAYLWETIGTICGGLILTYFFIPYLNSFQAVFIVSFGNLLLSLFFVRRAKRAGLKFSAIFIFLLVSLFLFSGMPDYFHRLSISRQWKGLEVLDYRNSVYGNIVATKSREQYTFFSNGIPVITTPYPDIIFAEEFGHLPLLSHSQPRSILIIGAGAGGVINEVLKHPVTKVDYLELDPLLISMVKKYPTALTGREFVDKRVKVINSDGRFFLKQAIGKYDLILIGVSRPSDLLSNRMFTREFFLLAKAKLNQDGILAFHLPGSLVYISRQLRDLNFSVLNALKDVYPYVRVIPGDYNMFLASVSPAITGMTAESVSKKIIKDNITTSLLLADYLKYRLNPSWVEWFNLSTKGATSKVNRDFEPFAVFKTMVLWNKQFSSPSARIFEFFEYLDGKTVCLGIVLLAIALFYSGRRDKNYALKSRLVYAIFATGFFGMLINLLLIFSFQVFYGYLYKMIGMLMSIFMAGIAAGSFFINRRQKTERDALKLFAGFEFTIISFTLLLAFMLNHCGDFISRAPLIYGILFFIPGFFVGAEFPLAAAIYLQGKEGAGKAAGALYFFDLLGGWLAGMLGGVLFLPLFGLFNTCIIIAVMKLSSFFLTIFSGPFPFNSNTIKRL